MVRRWRCAKVPLVVVVLASSSAAISALAPHGSALQPSLIDRPEEGDEIIAVAEDLEAALANGRLVVDPVEPEMIENVTTVITATVTLDLESEPAGEEVEIGLRNDARLIDPAGEACGTACVFQIEPAGWIRESIPSDGNDISWQWEVTPRRDGQHELILEIQPVLVILQSDRTDLAKRNDPIAISVAVHPNRRSFEAVLDAAASVQLDDAPEQLSVGDERTVRADLDLSSLGAGDVDVEMTLGQEPSDRLAITPAGPSGGDAGEWEWTIRGASAGPVELRLQIAASTVAGDRPLQDARERRTSLRVVPEPPSPGSRAWAVIGGLGVVVALLASALGLWTGWRKWRSAPAGSGGGPPGEEG